MSGKLYFLACIFVMRPNVPPPRFYLNKQIYFSLADELPSQVGVGFNFSTIDSTIGTKTSYVFVSIL